MTNETVANYQSKKNALDRIAVLEDKIAQLEANLQSIVPVLNQAQQVALETEAVVETLGRETVQNKVVELATTRAQELNEKQAAAVKSAVEGGQAVAVEAITETSLVVGVEKDKEGNVVPPGRLQFWFNNLSADFKAKLLGKKVGDTLDGALERTLTVTEIYELVAAKPAEATEAPAQ